MGARSRLGWRLGQALLTVIGSLQAPNLCRANPLELAAITEEDLPAQEMVVTGSPTATPTSMPAMPEGAVEPTPSSLPSPAPPPSMTSVQPAPTSSAVPALPPLTKAPNAGATPSSQEPPPIDLGAATTPQISEAPLTGLIDAAASPARAASLRLTEKARQEISNGKAGDAIQSLTRAISIDTSNPYAYFYLGRAYLLKKDCRQALIFLQRAEIGFVGNPLWLSETLSFEGVCYEQSGEAANALIAYKRALDSSPGNLMARAGYGRLASAAQPAPGATPAVGTDALPSSSEPPPPPEMPPPQPAPAESSPPAPE